MNYSRLQILLVDDNQSMRKITSTVLRGAGVSQVFEAHDVQAALDVLSQNPIDIAVVDFAMKPLDGVRFTRLVRSGETSAQAYLPIIMMTGHSEKHRVEEARDAGVNEFVAKPISASALINRIHCVVHKPRAFVRSAGYFGPCRRRSAARYGGPERRAADTTR